MNEATLKFNLDQVKVSVRAGLTVKQAFAENAGALGITDGTGCVYKSGNQVVDGNSLLLAGTTITATLARETKGA